jgi:hypothetical protein
LRSRSQDIPAAVPEDEYDSLYGLPLEDFTKERNALAKELRARGEREAAGWVGNLTKPTTAAWAVNQVMRTQRKDADVLLDAGDRLRKAHEKAAAGRGSARDLREAAEAEREAVGTLSRAARGLTSAKGRFLSEGVLERVAETLRAISGDPETRSLARVGRLSRESRATVTAALAASTAARRRDPKVSGPSPAEVRKARERLNRAQREVRDLRSARTHAARAIADAERALARTRKEGRQADRRVADKEAQIEELRRKLQQLG